MASLLVYVPLERVRTLLAPGMRNSGRAWAISRIAMQEPGLDRLGDEDTLFVFTVEDDGKAILFAAADDPLAGDGQFSAADALLRDHDITAVLPRLGCTDVARAAEWAKVPRILPPGDVDLLRYAIGMRDDLVRPPAAPEPIVADDEQLAALRAAVYAEPDADPPREIYADALQSRGDPRGELIALQLARAANNGKVTDRERTLLDRYGRDCAGPLGDVLHRFTLERGFVHSCVTRDVIPAALQHDPAWSTVYELATTDRTLLLSPHVRARRVGISGYELADIVRSPRQLPFEIMVGFPSRQTALPRHRAHTGMNIYSAWDELMRVGALERVRVMSMAGLAPDQVHELFRSALGRQLDHLDLYLWDVNQPPVAAREAFDRSSLTRMTFRFALSAYAPEHTPSASSQRLARDLELPTLVGFQRSSREPILRLQMLRPPRSFQLVELMRFLSQVTRGIQRIELHDVEHLNDISTRYAELITRLETIFARVVVRPSESMAP